MKKYPDKVSVVCLFDVYNITVAQHKPTFSVTWVKVRNGVSKVIKFKFLSDTRDQVVLGKDVFTGDSVSQGSKLVMLSQKSVGLKSC